jgi:elongation factor 1-alpha
MISGAAQADVCLLMVPADGNFTAAIQKGDHKAGEIQGQTRQHARLINLLGVRQLICGVNKMDSDTAGYKQERYKEISDEMKHMLARVGWKPDFIESNVPILPISGWRGDNLIAKSTNMTWWTGTDIVAMSGKKVRSARRPGAFARRPGAVWVLFERAEHAGCVLRRPPPPPAPPPSPACAASPAPRLPQR